MSVENAQRGFSLGSGGCGVAGRTHAEMSNAQAIKKRALMYDVPSKDVASLDCDVFEKYYAREGG